MAARFSGCVRSALQQSAALASSWQPTSTVYTGETLPMVHIMRFCQCLLSCYRTGRLADSAEVVYTGS